MVAPPVFDIRKGWRSYDGGTLLSTASADTYNPRLGQWGVMLKATSREPVFAPEAGEVVAVWTDAASSPDSALTVVEVRDGGPAIGRAGLVIRGASGVFHVIGRLRPLGLRGLGPVDEGQEVGRADGPPGVYWRVQLAAASPTGGLADIAVDPAEWLLNEDERPRPAATPAPGASSGGGALVALVVILLLAASRSRR